MDVSGYLDPAIFDGESIMYPSLLDADSPFRLDNWAGTTAGLSYSLVGNNSAYVYVVVGRTLIARVPVAFVPWYDAIPPVFLN